MTESLPPPPPNSGWPLVPGARLILPRQQPVSHAHRFGHLLDRSRRSLISALYPATCPGCDSVLTEIDHKDGHPRLCSACDQDLIPITAPYCSVCGEPFPIPTPRAFRCSNCGGRHLPFEFAIAPCLCEDLLLDLVHRFKYHRAWTLRQPLARLMLHAFEEPRVRELLNRARRCWLVPVPIHWRRERQRGYNQAGLLASALSPLTGLPVSDCLRRTLHTRSQATLQRSARIRNLRAAFAPRSRPWLKTPEPGDGVILIDDVFTTGSTAAACSRLLKRHFKVDKVVVITAGRG